MAMESTAAEEEAQGLEELLEKVYRQGQYDFRDYKRSTVTRRLERRLRAAGVKTYWEYMKFLDDCPEEYQKIADDLTIKVSGFFRSPCTFEQLSKLVLPELLARKEALGERALNFWSTACARGEEPYSLAILLDRFLGQRQRDFVTSIQATDISRWVLNEAKVGIYSVKDIANLPSDIVQDYFLYRGQDYEIRADIRNMVDFSYFDLTSTVQPFYGEMDCIFCCNVLIYLQKQLQERVLGLLYDSLAAPGYLVLGETETPTFKLGEKLECLDNKAKIYRKKIRNS